MDGHGVNTKKDQIGASEGNENTENTLGNGSSIFAKSDSVPEMVSVSCKSRKVDMPIFTSEYWKVLQYKEASYVHFFLTSPLSTICYFGEMHELYFSRVGLLMLYLNTWIFLLAISNIVSYYYYSYSIQKEYGAQKTKALFKSYLYVVHFIMVILSIFNITAINVLLGRSEVKILNTPEINRTENSSIALLPWMTKKAHSYLGIVSVYILMFASTIVLSYVENNYRFVTENRVRSLNQFKYVVIKTAAIISCLAVPSIHCLINSVLFNQHKTWSDHLVFGAYILFCALVYCVIGVFLTGIIYGSFTPWIKRNEDLQKEKKLRKTSKAILFAMSMASEVTAVLFISKWWLFDGAA
ncbi:hypothetical protein NEMIN01_1931 [Nematocida minor]|uniref:uncharacterized protein n=1 Tax=Nematocida minor TaxID=1912983 RepID=UPI00221EB812|nr:uncharacterized protein NEMIN01_1931 [Nematocida minor]KAI5192302.1 hypothetical protein NEMIN01_1931 [Nematocida minor]